MQTLLLKRYVCVYSMQNSCVVATKAHKILKVLVANDKMHVSHAFTCLKFKVRCTVPLTRRCVSHAQKYVCVLWTTKGACVSIVLVMKMLLVFRFVASFAFRIQNAYLFINCSIENGLAVLYWISGE